MSLHDDLLEQAQQLAQLDARRPKQANLRRVVSSAYYALFHLLASETSALYAAEPGPAAVDAISGACFMATRAAFEKAGLFTEDYFMYSDDLDLSYKIWHAGYKVACLTDCEVVHHGGKSSAQQSNHFAAVLQRESMAQYFAKTRGRFYSFVYRAAMGFSALLRVAVALALLVVTTLLRHNVSARALVQKWFAILAWSFGLQSWTRTAGARTHA